MSAPEPRSVPASAWRLRPPFRARHILLAAMAVTALLSSAQREGLGTAFRSTLDGLAAVDGGQTEASVARAVRHLARGLWPPQLSEETLVAELSEEQHRHPSLFARLEMRERSVARVDPVTLATRTTIEREEVLVRPLGYAVRVSWLMLETVEIGLLATVLGVLWSAPLAILASRNYAPAPVIYHAARGLVALLRAVPELISALFLVLAYGFGSAAGVLALALHCTGFLGKFFAEEIEHCDRAPQEALAALGAGRLKVLRFAVWPQVLPHYAGYICYVLDRNVRMATVIGLVGAGGIGQELKGRYDLFQYGHAMTIILAIFIVVLALDRLSDLLRSKLS